jgi:hypothetical protein
MTDAKDVVKRQIDRSGNTLVLALEPVSDDEFFRENLNGFSAAWVLGHLACVADLFSSWFDDQPLLLDRSFHQVFNDTAVTEASGISKAASVNPDAYPKAVLFLRLREAVTKALRVLNAFEISRWDAPGPPGVPASLLTGGAVWEILAAHIYWHCGELAGSMPRFFGTYTLNTLPHYFYLPPSKESGSHEPRT